MSEAWEQRMAQRYAERVRAKIEADFAERLNEWREDESARLDRADTQELEYPEILNPMRGLDSEGARIVHREYEDLLRSGRTDPEAVARGDFATLHPMWRPMAEYRKQLHPDIYRDTPDDTDPICRMCYRWRHRGSIQAWFGFGWELTCAFRCGHAHHDDEVWIA